MRATLAFEAATPHGPLHLFVPGAARHAADAAIVFERAAELLDALDAWAGGELAWSWPATSGAAHTMPVIVNWRGAQARLALPWSWLRSRPAPPASIASELEWPTVDAVLGLGELDLHDVDVAFLEPGGAVLLDEATTPRWRAADEAAPRGFEVRLETAEPLVLPADRLAPWCSEPPAVPAAPRASLWRGRRRLAWGTLAPWGDRSALLLESLEH